MKIRHNVTHHLAVDLSTLQRDIDNVSRVATSWGLNFNSAKCVVLRCQRGSTDWTTVGSLQHYHLDNSDLSLANNHRDLGILVDNTLKFHAHIRTTVHKAAGLANNLLKSTLCRSSDFMLAILKSHIRPILEFGSTVWNTGYLGDLRLLETVQRRWIKHIDGLADLPYADRLKALNLYSVQGRLLRADLIKCWKIFHELSVISPSDLFTISPITTTRGHRYKLAKPHIHTECRRRFFSIRCIDHWNSLPDSVVGANTLEAFKCGLHLSLGELLFAYTE